MTAALRNFQGSWRHGLGASLALVFLVAGAGSGRAQADDADELEPVSRAPYSSAVVQPLPTQQSYQLNAALTRLAANPRDVAADRKSVV